MRIGHMRVERDQEDERLVEVSRGWRVPERFVAHVALEEPPYRLRLAVAMSRQEPVCVGLQVTPLPSAEAVTGTGLRGLAVHELVVTAAARVAVPPVELVEGVRAQTRALTKNQFSIEVDDMTGEVNFVPSLETQLAAQAAVARGRVDVELLEAVARVYREAHEASQPPSRQVAQFFHYSDSHARRLVQRARDHGFLKPTTPGRKGG